MNFIRLRTSLELLYIINNIQKYMSSSVLNTGSKVSYRGINFWRRLPFLKSSFADNQVVTAQDTDVATYRLRKLVEE